MASDPRWPHADPPVWADLVRAVADRRDRAAFTALFDHFGPRVKAYMGRLGLDDARAEDMMQEVLFSVWRRAHLYDRGRASVSTWVFTIARNKRIDQLRREHHPEVDYRDPALVPEPDPPDAEAEMDGRALARLRAALADLPPQQAEVVRLNFLEDKPHTAIADQLGVPLGTVKSRVRLALIKLRQVLNHSD